MTAAPPTDEIRAKLADRYGRGSGKAPRWLIATGVVIALAVVGGFGWLTVANTLDAVDADTTGFVVVDEHTVELSFQVTAPLDTEVACALEAQDEQHGIVGWAVLVLPASDQHTRAFSEVIPTTALATTGLINSCWVP